MWQRGFWTVLRRRGVPLRVHFSLPLCAVFLTGFRFSPGGWLGFLLVVLVHEIGHALVVRRFRLPVASIDLHGFGGECRFEGFPTEAEVAAIAWGGVVAQALLLPLGFLVAPRLPAGFAHELLGAFGWANLWLIGFNLLPSPPLDGAEAWQLPVLLWRARRERLAHRRQRARQLAERKRQSAERVARELAERERADDEMPELPDAIARQIAEAMRRAREDEGHER